MKTHIYLISALLFISFNLSAQFIVPPLPYAYGALEPSIDEATMKVHHDVHHKAYVDNLNKALVTQPTYASRSVETLISEINRLPKDIRTAVRNNGGGHFNHSFFWKILTPANRSSYGGPVATAIEKEYGSFADFKKKFEEAGISRFGSGWAWLVVKNNGSLEIVSTPNQDNPLMDVAEVRGMPVLAVDVWEHAYYLKYKSARADYLKAFWNVVNWDEVNRLYQQAVNR